MAVKKPIVINSDGELEQLQSADRTQEAAVFSLTNDNAGNLVIATPIYSSSAGGMDKAQADTVGTKDVIGLVVDTDTAPAASGGVQSAGHFEATTTEWDTVTGDVGGLTTGDKYFLDPDTAGLLTLNVSTTEGDFIAPVGIALSTTELRISINQTVKL